MVLLGKLFKKKNLSLEDLSYLNKLLATNMPIKNALSLIENKGNKYIVDKIMADLDNGVLIENAIHGYLPSSIDSYLRPLLKSLPFAISLDISFSFYEKQMENEKQIVSSIGYPCFLLFVSISALYLFDLYGVDAIFEAISSFQVNFSLIDSIRKTIRIIVYVFYYGFLLLVALIALYSRPKKVTYLYLLLSKYMPNSLVHVYYCEQFVSLLLICSKRGYKTKQSLEILKEMKNKPIISFLAYHLDDYLLKGETLRDASKQAYYDTSLSRFIKIASYASDFENTLGNYVLLAKEKIVKKAKRYTLTIQLCTYIFIGAIIIFIYQILFMPMQALSNL